MVAYGGDEVNALVLDIGSTVTRAGYAGEDTPRVMLPTTFGYIDTEETAQQADGDTVMTDGNEAVAEPTTTKKRQYFIGDNKINKFKSHMQLKSPLKDGLVEDWEAMEQIWNTAFIEMLRIRPEEHPLLCTEPAWNTKENREKTVELAFEKFQFPAFYLVPDAVMTAFSAGRATALVLDSGGSVTSAVPVYDGFVLKKGILHQPIAGDLLSEKIRRQLKSELDYVVTPHYRIAKKKPVDPDEKPDIQLRELDGLTESFNDNQINRIINEFKETICQVSDTTYDESVLSSRSKKRFEFPDGYNHDFGVDCYKVPEILFQPDIFSEKTGEDETMEDDETNEGQDDIYNGSKYIGVHEMVYNSINNCDIDLRPLLFNNVVVTGGNTLLNGFNERLNHELPLKAPSSKVKIHATGNTTERKSSSWLGGSIVASLGTFHQLWISRKEYEEMGASVIHRKC